MRMELKQAAGPVRRVLGAAALIVAAGALSGCETPGAAAPAPEPAPAPAAEGDASPTPQQVSAPAPREPAAPRAPELPKVDALNLNVVYLERLLVPAGSSFAITVTDAGGGATTTLPSQEGPPYAVTVPLRSDASYPMTVDVVLTSTLGHTLSGSVQLDAAPSGAVEVLIRTST